MGVRNAGLFFFYNISEFPSQEAFRAFLQPSGASLRGMSDQPRRPKCCSSPHRNQIFSPALSSDPASGYSWYGKAFFFRVRATLSTQLAMLARDGLRWAIPRLWWAALQSQREWVHPLLWRWQGFVFPQTHTPPSLFCFIPGQGRGFPFGAEAPKIPLLPPLLYPR